MVDPKSQVLGQEIKKGKVGENLWIVESEVLRCEH